MSNKKDYKEILSEMKNDEILDIIINNEMNYGDRIFYHMFELDMVTDGLYQFMFHNHKDILDKYDYFVVDDNTTNKVTYYTKKDIILENYEYYENQIREYYEKFYEIEVW